MRAQFASIHLWGVALMLALWSSMSTQAQTMVLVDSHVNPANGSSYVLFEPSSWTDAQAECVLYGGNLVTVDDDAENEWIKSVFPAVNTWIGYRDVLPGPGQVFEWVSGSASTYGSVIVPMGTVPWGAGEPNDSGDYAYFWVNATPPRGWDDTQNFGIGTIYGLLEIVACGVDAPTGLTGVGMGADVELSWTNNGPYTGGIEVYRDGVSIATLAGTDTSYLDTGVPLAGTYKYLLRASDGVACNAFGDAIDFDHGSLCAPPTAVVATESSGTIDLAWDNNGTTWTEVEIIVNGLLYDTVVGSPSSYTYTPGDGAYVHVIHGVDSAAIPACEATSDPSAVLTIGNFDLIWRAEQDGGLVQSATELQATLQALGRAATITDDLVGCACLSSVDADQILWICLGTYPQDHCLDANEGQIIKDFMTLGGAVYIEGGDAWGFCGTNPFRDVDGVDGLEVDGTVGLDGDDSFTAMVGGVHDVLDLTAMSASYTQDAGAAIDWTDQIAPTGFSGLYGDDLGGNNAGVIWTAEPGVGAYTTGIFYLGDAPYGRVIAQSWEFGGYGGDWEMLAQRYVEALSGGALPGSQFRRGDTNGDGAFDISDVVFTLAELFTPGAAATTCNDASDSNDDGAKDISDAVYALAALFTPGSPPIPAPGPSACGIDPTPDSLECDLYDACP